MTDKTPKRELIKERILEGGATKEDLMEVADVNSAGLASQFSYLRLTGFYPVIEEDGTYGYTDKDGWEAIQAEKAARRKPVKKLTPPERLTKATKRVERTKKAAETAELKYEKLEVPTREDELRKDLTSIQAELAEIEFDRVKEEFDKWAEENPTEAEAFLASLTAED